MIVGGGVAPAMNLTRQDVHRPRPPHVAVMSTPAACAVLRMDVPGARESARVTEGSRGSVRSVRRTATTVDSTPGLVARRDDRVSSAQGIHGEGGEPWHE